jgi:N-carbamoylputrescine amidase
MEKMVVSAVSTRNLINQPDAAIADMRFWCEKAASQDAELVLFPELNITGYIQHTVSHAGAETVHRPSTEKVITIAQDLNLTIACGLLERESDRYFCTHIVVNENGLIGKQRKIHTPAQELPYWGKGDSIEVIDTGKIKAGITICRDSFFDEMTRTLYFKGAELVLMPFGYYNVARSRYLKESIHGMSIVKACWTNGYYALVCNSAGNRSPSEWESEGNKFPGWAGVIAPWGNVLAFIEDEGNDQAMVVVEITPEALADRRNHVNFLAKELRNELYQSY